MIGLEAGKGMTISWMPTVCGCYYNHHPGVLVQPLGIGFCGFHFSKRLRQGQPLGSSLAVGQWRSWAQTPDPADVRPGHPL